MKLKPIVTSLIVLGLASPAFAANNHHGKSTQKAPVAKKQALKITKKEPAVVSSAVMLPPISDKFQSIIDQNSASSPVLSCDWIKRIAVGGLINFDASWGNRTPIGSFADNSGNSGSNSNFRIANANLFIDPIINDWVIGHLNLEYTGTSHDITKASTVFVNSYDRTNRIRADEAYLTIRNFNRSPLYAKLGWQYIPFGTYQRYPMVTTLTQTLEQTSGATATLGLISDLGPYVQVFAFNGPMIKGNVNDGTKVTGNSQIADFGAKIGSIGNLAALRLDGVNYNVDLSYIRNMFDTDTLYAAFTTSTSGGVIDGLSIKNDLGADRVGGLAAHLGLNYKSVDFVADYAGALGNMMQNRWLENWSDTLSTTTESSRLWAAGLGAGYAFPVLSHASRLGLSYQWTGNGQFTNDVALASGVISNTWDPSIFSMPHNRWLLDYKVNILKNTDLGFALAYDRSYPYRNSSSDIRKSTTALMRVSAQF